LHLGVLGNKVDWFNTTWQVGDMVIRLDCLVGFLILGLSLHVQLLLILVLLHLYLEVLLCEAAGDPLEGGDEGPPPVLLLLLRGEEELVAPGSHSVQDGRAVVLVLSEMSV